FYVFQLSTALILAVAANTGFSAFPMLSFNMAQNKYMPHLFGKRGTFRLFKRYHHSSRRCYCLVIHFQWFNRTSHSTLHHWGLYSICLVTNGHGCSLETQNW